MNKVKISQSAYNINQNIHTPSANEPQKKNVFNPQLAYVSMPFTFSRQKKKNGKHLYGQPLRIYAL